MEGGEGGRGGRQGGKRFEQPRIFGKRCAAVAVVFGVAVAVPLLSFPPPPLLDALVGSARAGGVAAVHVPSSPSLLPWATWCGVV